MKWQENGFGQTELRLAPGIFAVVYQRHDGWRCNVFCKTQKPRFDTQQAAMDYATGRLTAIVTEAYENLRTGEST